MSFPNRKPIYLLVDNGSLRPESTLSLRRIALRLGQRTGKTVYPVSLLHSDKVDPAEINGEPAITFLPFLRKLISKGKRDFRLLPLFFGPSRALTEYIPQQVAQLRSETSDLRLELEPCLCPGDSASDSAMVSILVDAVRRQIEAQGLVKPYVALVDHGTPARAVNEVRDRLSEGMAKTLGDEVVAVGPCSMERREGPAYDFNEPLLEKRLRQPGWSDANVVVAMLFLQPGRHAGAQGDVAEICTAAEADCQQLKTYMTPLVGEHPGLIDLLANRLSLAAHS
ncbi:MAG: CbiX/SirB N-terminal domain-containing protein [Verrucomicrobiota bacterium]